MGRNRQCEGRAERWEPHSEASVETSDRAKADTSSSRAGLRCVDADELSKLPELSEGRLHVSGINPFFRSPNESQPKSGSNIHF